MAINTSLFTAQSGDYAPIIGTITANDALVLEAIIGTLNTHSQGQNLTLQDYIAQGICVNMEGFNVASIATLKAVGVISTNDNIHIGLTPLGYGFYESIKQVAG